jgi:K+-transporting ATPase c subunit
MSSVFKLALLMVFLPSVKCRPYRQSTANGSQVITQRFEKRGYFDSANTKTMRAHAHGRGFSVNASVQVSSQSSALW